MTLREKTLDTLTKSLKHLQRIAKAKSAKHLDTLASGIYFNFGYDGSIQIEARTQQDVRVIRSCFRGIIWKKNFVDYAQQWEYKATTRDGVDVRIYGVKEGPAQCKMVEETVLEEREVPAEPVRYIKQMVEVKKVRYICPDGDKANGS